MDTPREREESCIGCQYSTNRRIDTYWGCCTAGSATDPLTGAGKMPGLTTVRLVDWQYGKCDKYTRNETCKSCGLPIMGTKGESTLTTVHADGANTTTKDPGPYHYPECMPAIKWNHNEGTTE